MSQSTKKTYYTRKEILSVTVQKKQECNTRALRIVETLLEENVSIEWLLENVKYIAQSHLQDAFEERAISKLCGYPVCSKGLGHIPQQRFHISTRTNKVYDVTERKHFCSNYCYKAAQYLKAQLLTSPVWLRDNEIIPEFHLFSRNSTGEEPGEEVELRHDTIKLPRDDINSSSRNEKNDIPVRDLSVISQDQHVGNESSRSDKSNSYSACNYRQPHTEKISNTNNENTDAVAQNDEREDTLKSGIPSEKCDFHKVEVNINRIPTEKESTIPESRDKNKEFVDESISVNETKKCHKNAKSSQKSRNDSKHSSNQLNFVSRIEKSFKAWFTLESFFYIYGSEKAKELMKDKKDCLKEYYKGVEQKLWEPETQKKYIALCKKLDLLELEEKLIENNDKKCDSKPLPNLEQIKRDAQTMELKVKEFYGRPVNIKDKTNLDIQDDRDCVIPLVELHAQNALRRRIVLDRLQHVLPDLLRTFGLASRDISGDVRSLVTTFSLGADNIMFKPAEWNLIGLIIIKMLSMKEPKLKTLMDTQLAQKYTSMMLMGFQLDGGYLERLITWLADIDILLGKTHINV